MKKLKEVKPEIDRLLALPVEELMSALKKIPNVDLGELGYHSPELVTKIAKHLVSCGKCSRDAVEVKGVDQK